MIQVSFLRHFYDTKDTTVNKKKVQTEHPANGEDLKASERINHLIEKLDKAKAVLRKVQKELHEESYSKDEEE